MEIITKTITVKTAAELAAKQQLILDRKYTPYKTRKNEYYKTKDGKKTVIILQLDKPVEPPKPTKTTVTLLVTITSINNSTIKDISNIYSGKTELTALLNAIPKTIWHYLIDKDVKSINLKFTKN